MLIGIQIAGTLFGLLMLYLSHLYYRRNELGLFDFGLWCIIWIGYLYAVIFPQSLNVILETLGVISAMDLFTIISFMVGFMIIFHLYRTTRKLQQKIEKIVTGLAKK